MKTLKQIITGLALGAALLLPQQTKAEESLFYGDLSFGLNFEKPIVKQVDKVPLEIRNLPAQESWYNSQPIEKDYAEMYNRLSLMKVKGGLKLPLNEKVNLKLGAALDWNFDLSSHWTYYEERRDAGTRDPYASQANSRNRTNLDKCESGTSSRNENVDYYYIHPSFLADWNTFFRPSLFSELEFQVNDEKKLKFGVEAYPEKISARTGYSRNSGDDIQEELGLAGFFVIKPYLDYDVKLDFESSVRFGIGMQKITNCNYTRLGKKADFKFNDPALCVGVSIIHEF